MDNEIQLISDGDGLAVIGDPTAVERFLASEGLPSKDLGLPRLGAALSAGAAVAQAGSEIAANSGRWVKLTKESAQLVKKYGLMKSSDAGRQPRRGDAKHGQDHGTSSRSRRTPGSMLTNPAMLAGAAGIMAQLAMQQTMDEITDYLATIDEKLDDVLRAQKDAVLARHDRRRLRDRGGHDRPRARWAGSPRSPGRRCRARRRRSRETQAYALRQLDALAEKLERKTKIGDLAKAAKEAEATVEEWLAVLARCFQLQDAIAVLELDRVLDAAPDDLDRHRLGLQAARQNRLELISRSTERLLARMDAAAGTANTKVLLHPIQSPAVVQSSNHVAGAVVDFHGRLGIESGRRVGGGESAGWTPPRRPGTRCSRPEPRASMSPGASATRPSTGPGPVLAAPASGRLAVRSDHSATRQVRVTR